MSRGYPKYAREWVAKAAREKLGEYPSTETVGDGDPDEWPYPTRRIETQVRGTLEAAVRARLDLGYGSCNVTLVEYVISDGYSEYTTDDRYDHELWVNGEKVWSTEDNFEAWTGIRKLIEWLEEV